MRKLIMPVMAILILAIFPMPPNAALAAPPNFRLDRAFTISLAVTWDKPAYAVKEYIVYKNGVVYRRTGTTNFNMVQGLTAGTSYSLYVKAVDMYGNVSNPSNAIKVATTKTDKKFSLPIRDGQEQGYFEDIGIDFYSILEADCLAAAAGEVTFAGYDPFVGNKVTINLAAKPSYDGFTAQEIFYSHLKEIKVQAGDMLSTGQVIGTIDWKDESHLHFGITVDAPNIYFVAGNAKWKYDWGYNYNRDQVYALLGLTRMK